MLRLEELARELVHKLKVEGVQERHYAELEAQLNEIDEERKAHAEQIERALELHGRADVEIDADPILSVSYEGVFVSAWVWVPFFDNVDYDDDGETL